MLDRRYEKQMTREERKQFEKEKLSQMTGKEKLEYLWMYYKIWLLVPVAVIAAIYLGVTMYRGMNEEILLNLVVVDGLADDYEGLESEIREYLGAEKSNQTVRINSNITSGAYQGEAAFSTLIGTESVDVVICPESFCDEDGRDVLEKAFVLEESKWLKKEAGIEYEPVCICIAKNTPNRENAEAFLELVEENK
ncbi:hypothetical protein [Merdimonas faecis]|uniref:Extracellular solute-binding protein n=1 Tax=Merdimonas faecis TaxID=1653435 RepID=A0A9D3AJD6_9FIRM|nr:hypothetical protein [Merdimonas faecis]HJH50027.1 hypothetical protein [Merdimonas faecis]